MKIVKFASIVLGKDYHPSENSAAFSNEYNDTTFIGVSSIDEACALVIRLADSGYECVELCGAFGEAGARKVMEAAGGKIAIGYSVHFPEQDALFDRLFS